MHVASGWLLPLQKKRRECLPLFVLQTLCSSSKTAVSLTATKSAAYNLQLTSPLSASATDLAFSCPIQLCCLSQASDWTGCGSSAKGHTDKEAEPIMKVSSGGSAQQTSVVKVLMWTVEPFHRSHKGLQIIKISLILRYCRECEVSVQPTCKTKQLHSARVW